MSRPGTQRAIAAGSLILTGLIGLFVSFGIYQMKVTGSGYNYGLIIGLIGAALSLFLVGLALHLLFSGRKFFDLASGLLLAAFISGVLLAFEVAIYIALVLIMIAFNSLNAQ